MVFLLSDFGLTAGLFCFKGKGPDQFKTVFRTLDLVLLFHKDRLIEIEIHVHTCNDNYLLINLTTELIIF